MSKYLKEYDEDLGRTIWYKSCDLITGGAVSIYNFSNRFQNTRIFQFIRTIISDLGKANILIRHIIKNKFQFNILEFLKKAKSLNIKIQQKHNYLILIEELAKLKGSTLNIGLNAELKKLAPKGIKINNIMPISNGKLKLTKFKVPFGLSNNSYDTIILNNSLCYIDNIHNTLPELYHSLKPAGKLIIRESSLDISEIMYDIKNKLENKTLNFYFRTPDQIKMDIEMLGFKFISERKNRNMIKNPADNYIYIFEKK